VNFPIICCSFGVVPLIFLLPVPLIAFLDLYYHRNLVAKSKLTISEALAETVISAA
jgi:hypothetical protein